MISKENILRKMDRKLWLVICWLIIGAGCAPVISQQLIAQAQKIPFDEIVKDPEAWKGNIVILSGIILDAKNTQEGTLMEILQTPADSSGKPKDMDKSKGRFMALHKGFLDVEVYRRGREITIGGEITGKKVLKIGKIDYTYPFIKVYEIHLWPIEKEERVYYYPEPYWWHPWWYYRYPWLYW